MTIISHDSSITLGAPPPLSRTFLVSLSLSLCPHGSVLSLSFLNQSFSFTCAFSPSLSYLYLCPFGRKKNPSQRIKEDGRDMASSQSIHHPLFPIIISQSHSVTGSAVCCTDTFPVLGVCVCKCVRTSPYICFMHSSALSACILFLFFVFDCSHSTPLTMLASHVCFFSLNF